MLRTEPIELTSSQFVSNTHARSQYSGKCTQSTMRATHGRHALDPCGSMDKNIFCVAFFSLSKTVECVCLLTFQFTAAADISAPLWITVAGEISEF